MSYANNIAEGGVMSEFKWFRSWHGAPTDEKWPVIAARSGVGMATVVATGWKLMDYASQHENRGSVEGFDTEAWATYLHVPEADVVAVREAMIDKKMITNGRLTSWEKRQPKREDDSRDRVRKFRAMERNVTQGNAPDRDIDSDTESEKEKEAEAETEPAKVTAAAAPSRPEIFTLYEHEIGQITPMISEALIAAEKEYPPNWISAAIQEAVEHNARSWKYTDAVLRSWKANGFKGKKAEKKSYISGEWAEYIEH